jgi:hypothetical protein
MLDFLGEAIGIFFSELILAGIRKLFQLFRKLVKSIRSKIRRRRA